MPIGTITYLHLERLLEGVYRCKETPEASCDRGGTPPAVDICSISLRGSQIYGLENDPSTALRDDFKRPQV